MSEQITQVVKILRKIEASISPGSELAYEVKQCLGLLGQPTREHKSNPKTDGLILPDAIQIEKGEKPSSTSGMITTQSLGYSDEVTDAF